MRLKAKEASEVTLTIVELRDQIKANFKDGDILHIVKSKRRITKKEIEFKQCYDSFFIAETVLSPFYSETLSISYADLLVGSVAIQEIQTKKPIEG